eukprot:332972_1
MAILTCLILVVSLINNVNSISPDDFLINSLPLYNGTNANKFEQYSGYMNLDDDDETALFFWFVASMRDPTTDPLILWMSGGPGVSSIFYGLWTEHGPWRLTPNATNVIDYEYSWNKIANIIYLETPSGAGFSYSNNSNGYNCSDNKTSFINYIFLDNFYTIFDKYKSNKLYIMSESYGGHYIPQLAMRIIEFQNDTTHNFTNNKLIYKNMNGFLIGNPSIIGDEFFGPNKFAYFIFMWSHGLLPQNSWIEMLQKCEGWNSYLTNCSAYDLNPSQECQYVVNYALDNYINISDYDILNIYAPTCHKNWNSYATNYMKYYSEYNPCIDDWTPEYMNREDTLKAIHAYDHYNRVYPSLPNNWYYQNGTYNLNQLFPIFFQQQPKWRITIVNGDADSAVSHIGTQRWIECLNRKVVKNWSYWYQHDEEKYEVNIGGAVKIYDGITYQTVKHCGHTIPTYCPHVGFVFFQQFLNGSFSG